MKKSIKIFVLSLGLVFVLSVTVFAQEPVAVSPEITAAINLDENIQANDLGVKEPRILPDSPFYFLKNLGRSIQSFFTFNPIAKAELKEKFASEKLMELKKLVQKNKDPKILKEAIENYQEEAGKIKTEAEKIKEKAKDNPKVENFLDKLTQHQILHQRILDKLETQVQPEIFEKIKEAREEHLEKFGEVMVRLGDKEKIPERLEKNLEEIKGSQFQNFKNLEILKNLEEKVPEEAKGAIQKAQENVSKRLVEDLGKMNPADQEKFKEYTEKISGEKEKHLEILENLKTEVEGLTVTPQTIKLKEKIEEWEIKVQEKIEQKLIEPIKPSIEPAACVQVITPAIGPKNICKEFPTPCDVPEGWKKIDKCPSVSTSPVPSALSKPSAPSISPIPPTSSVPPKPSTSSEPIPTEIRYYTCPDGTKVESGKCYGKGETLRCALRVSPELQCPAPTPPVPKGGVCATAGETKYYECPNNTQTTWCVCGPESGAVGAKNVWRCQYLPELSCPKPIPAPVSQPVACYIQKDCVFVENKDDCLKKGGSPSSESSCPAPAPAPVPLACTVSGIKDYKCPDGTLIKWQCSCGEDSWSCQTNPTIFCPGLRDTTSLIISDIWIRDMFWTEEPPVPNMTQGPGIFHVFWGTSKPATSYMEYGLTTSYGLTTPSCCLGIQHTNNGQSVLEGGTLYHSRIIATDTQGNTAASDDFTFFPAFNFTTIPGTVQPYIRLLGPGISPTHWKIGENGSIVWEARGVNKVNIDLVMFDSSGNRLKTYSIAKSVSSSGTAGGSYIYTWKVPSNSGFLQAGNKFKVVISDPVIFVFGTNANDLFIEE